MGCESDRACTNFIFGIAEYFFEGNIKNKLALVNVLALLYDGSTGKDIKLCVSYFLLFLKEQYVSWLFQTKCFEKKFNLQLFYLPTVSRTLILSWATTRYPSPRNFLF